MLSDKKYGLSVNLMATRVMPSLLPQTVNPSLNLDQFTILLEVLQEMLDHIDRNQRNKLKLDNLSLPSPERHRPLRHQMSSDNMHVPPFNIPNLRIEHRKTSSAEDMARKNSTVSIKNIWWKTTSRKVQFHAKPIDNKLILKRDLEVTLTQYLVTWDGIGKYTTT
ncbi:hypothetical protein RUM44_009560 [Polyplax serrata]|uniref:Uncharacterized protein n=1 Tax=Polyplax serrata TaxID=468196 RepID=A0ABR1AUH4_POLSC